MQAICIFHVHFTSFLSEMQPIKNNLRKNEDTADRYTEDEETQRKRNGTQVLIVNTSNSSVRSREKVIHLELDSLRGLPCCGRN